MGETLGVAPAVEKPRWRGSKLCRGARSRLKRSSGTTGKREVANSPQESDFSSDLDRYEWELSSRFDSMDTLDRWVASDGVHTIGPPIPPGATVFKDEKATPAFEKATAKGFLACRPAAEAMGLSRKTVRKIIDRVPEARVAYVVYPGKLRGTRYHCRVIHKDSIRMMKRNIRMWTKRSVQGGKKTTAKNIRRGC